MSELERLAATCLLPGFPGLEPPDWIRRWLQNGLGGVVLYAWNVESPKQLAALTAALRAEREDVLVSTDEEGGDVTRLEVETGCSYPGNAALGAVDDVELTELVAAAMGASLAETRVGLDLAPVADVNTNPSNPIIGIRSFGADSELVARHVAAFVRGLQGAGVAACAKHFPGHGDTDEDSHLELPVVNLDRETFFAQALPPFRAAIEADVKAIMTAHILVRAVDEIPATMSRTVLHGLLREELAFEGMVVTDALEMKAISATVGVDEGAVQALAAGADALCLGHDLGEDALEGIVGALVEAVQSGRLSEARLLEAAGRVDSVATWVSQPAATLGGDREIGLVAARRAVRSEGNPVLSRPPFVIEVTPDPSIAAGASPGPGEWLRRALHETDVALVRPWEASSSVASRDGTQPVVIVRDAHRHPWQRETVEKILAGSPDAIVVEVGLPHWRPSRSRGYLATYGAARVNLEAAAERLSGSTLGSAILPPATRGGAVR